ncbi:MAG: MBL fold metallo-hydrolase, partial [Alphaproteobacteria bacterium]|nr:MBL fold metallo-hydrolase [Alphaproteobacteria bacterium]
MNDIVVEYPYDEPPSGGTARRVAEGLWWVRMPLPFVLDHINLYLLEDGNGWTVIDCGLNKDGVRDLWETLIHTLLAGRPIRRVLVTHFHPDHMGLAQWLLARFPDAELWMSLSEWLWSHFAFDARERNMEEMLRFWRRNGMA